MVADLEPDPAAMRRVAASGYSTATDLADWLVRVPGLPFRQAHHVAGSLVKLAEAQGVGLADLPLAAMQAVEPGITEAVYEVLTVERSVASRTSLGGTSPVRVREAIAAARAARAGEEK
jgi:argininosuccinate lyase